MNHHKQHDISSDCMKLAIHQVEDMAIDVPHLLARKFHSAFQDSKIKRVKLVTRAHCKKLLIYVNLVL